MQLPTRYLVARFLHGSRGGTKEGGGAGGGKSLPKDFKKGKNEKNVGYFYALKLLKLAFLSSLTRKYVLWKGFYHDFSTKKASALTTTKELCPLDPRRGHCPWTPDVPSPPPQRFTLAPPLHGSHISSRYPVLLVCHANSHCMGTRKE